MKVLHLLPPAAPRALGGVELYVASHYKHIDQEKFQFDFLTQNRALEHAEQFKGFRCKVRLLPGTAAENRDLFISSVKDILTDGYDALHLHTCFWTGYLLEELAKEAGIRKVIVHSHNTFIDEPDAEKRKILFDRHEEVKSEFSEDMATDFWACSKAAADWLFGPQIPRNKIRLMKNAIELERFQFDQRKRDHIRAELGLQDSLVLGTVGRISYLKNPEFLIDLFETFHQKYRDSKLIIVGDGSLRPDLERRIQEKNLIDSVLLLGWKTNVEDYLQAMDCFLMPSRFEALGIAALEAVASGLRCVVSDQTSKELEFTDHIHRVPLDIDAWISALEEMEQLPSDRCAGTEILRAAGYDIKQQAKILEELYQA